VTTSGTEFVPAASATSSTGRGPGGVFAKGNRIGRAGRSPGYDFRVAAADMAKREGLTLQEALERVIATIYRLALAGDARMAQLFVDRVAPDDAGAQGSLQIVVATGVPRQEAPEKVRDVEARLLGPDGSVDLFS
jgi:hypothetical protein